MPRYALIDIDSGFVSGVRDANDPVAACKALDEEQGEHGLSYQLLGGESQAHLTGQPGYIVHEGAPDLDHHDGQDPDYISAIEKLPRVAVVLASSATAEQAA